MLTQFAIGLAFSGVFAVLMFRRPILLISTLLIGLLFHEWVLRWLTNSSGLPAEVVSGISLWKEAAIAVLVMAAMKSWITGEARSPLRNSFRLADGFLGLFALLGVVNVMISPNRLAGVAAFRDYFEPILIFVLVRTFFHEQADLNRILKWWLGAGALIAAVGIWQAVAWAPNDYRAWGFGEPTPEIGVPTVFLRGGSYLRPPSTVTGPNELALHMVLLSLFTIASVVSAQGNTRWVLAALALLFGACLLVTASRSGLLAFVVGLGILGLAKLRDRDQSKRPIRRGLRAFIPLIVVLLLAVAMALTGVLDFLVSTVKGLSAEYHVQDTIEAVEFLSRNPGGVGMGLVGPRVGTFFPTVPAFHAEGSIFQIALDMGVWGLAVFLLFLGAAVTASWRSWQAAATAPVRDISTTAFSGWLAALIMFLLLPLMQSMTLMSWLWFLLGIAFMGPRLESRWLQGRDGEDSSDGVQTSPRLGAHTALV